MKIGIISFIAPYTMPYIEIYLNNIRKLGLECDVLYWDREGNAKNEIVDKIHYIPYTCITGPEQSAIRRDIKYIPVVRFMIKKLKENDYDKVIFLQTHAAVFCKSIIRKKYAYKYLIDIRDFTLENISFYKKIEEDVINKSYCTVISSEGYKAFLPKYNYVVAHNFSPVSEEVLSEIQNSQRKRECINISFIGYVRFYEMAKKILLLFANDSRFHVSYIGTGANALGKFCENNNITNVTLHDRFKPEETTKFYQACDMINNLYGNHDKYLDYALSNKLYYAAQFQLPVLVSEETYSSEIAEKYNIGISWNPDEEDAVDKLYEKFCLFDREKMRKLSKEFLDKVINENDIFEKKIIEFLTS